MLRTIAVQRSLGGRRAACPTIAINNTMPVMVLPGGLEAELGLELPAGDRRVRGFNNHVIGAGDGTPDVNSVPVFLFNPVRETVVEVDVRYNVVEIEVTGCDLP